MASATIQCATYKVFGCHRQVHPNLAAQDSPENHPVSRQRLDGLLQITFPRQEALSLRVFYFHVNALLVLACVRRISQTQSQSQAQSHASGSPRGPASGHLDVRTIRAASLLPIREAKRYSRGRMDAVLCVGNSVLGLRLCCFPSILLPSLLFSLPLARSLQFLCFSLQSYPPFSNVARVRILGHVTMDLVIASNFRRTSSNPRPQQFV